MTETFERTIQRNGRERGDVVRHVMLAEKEAEQVLGGPVVRSQRFIGNGQVTLTWRLK